MTFRVDPATGVQLLDGGRVALDSEWTAFVTTQVRAGYFTIPLTKTSSPIVSKVTTLLQSGLNPSSTWVDGNMFLSRTGNFVGAGFGVLDDAVLPIGGTTIIYADAERIKYDSIKNPFQTYETGILDLAVVVAVTFYASGGKLYVDVERYIPGLASPNNYPDLNGTITVRYIAYVHATDN